MTIPPTNPFHISRAYSLPGVQRSGPAFPALDAAKATKIREDLVAAEVDGRVTFDPAPRAGDAMAFYANPASRNAAATGVEVGRTLDVNG